MFKKGIFPKFSKIYLVYAILPLHLDNASKIDIILLIIINFKKKKRDIIL